MVEPFSLAVNVVQIISACTSTIKTIDHLIRQYKDASKKLESLASEAQLVKATLNQFNIVLKGKSSFFAAKLEDDTDLKSAIDRTLTGCWTVFLLLHKELRRLLPQPGKDVKAIQKAGLLFNDDFIQDYRSQIRGHVQGLESVLICLQAQTVAETHDILRKASETLERIANATVNIREQHKEYSFPESVYEGFSTFEEDKEFDKELLNTPAYRAAFKTARKNSLIGGNESFTGTSSQSTRIAKQPSKDFLSDQPLEERKPNSEHLDLLSVEGLGDLIDFDDEPTNWNGRPVISPSAQLMEGLSWDSNPEKTATPILDGELAEMAIPGITSVDFPKVPAPFSDGEVPTRPKLQPGLVRVIDSLTLRCSKDISDEYERRDSAQIPMLHGRNTQSTSLRHSTTPSIILPTDEKFSVLPNEHHTTSPAHEQRTMITHQGDDGLIPVWTEQLSSHTSSVSRTDSNSTENTRAAPWMLSTTTADLSPGAMSPLSEHSIPSIHRWSNPPVNVPLADDQIENNLFSLMPHSLNDPDMNVRLDWAEDALRHCAVNAAHTKRLADMKVKKKAPKPSLSERESILMTEATQVVNLLRRKEHGRAYFLGARYIVPQEEKKHLYLLADGRGHHRALFYLGEMSENQGVQGDAVVRYENGANLGDAACLYRLAKAYLSGELGKKKDKERYIRYLQQAALAADKDCPDPLHDLAVLHLERPSTGFSLKKSKPLVPHNISTATAGLRRAAFFGHGPSQLRLGQVHRHGYFDPEDAKKAEKAAIKLSRTTSTRNRRESANSTISAGSPEGDIDLTFARHYLHLAARRGIPRADYEIAHDLIFDSGGLATQYARTAYAHATRALIGGVPQAYGLMGKAHEEGIGCKQDKVLAEKYYFDGGTKGDSFARTRGDILRNQGIGVDGLEAGYIRSK